MLFALAALVLAALVLAALVRIAFVQVAFVVVALVCFAQRSSLSLPQDAIIGATALQENAEAICAWAQLPADTALNFVDPSNCWMFGVNTCFRDVKETNNRVSMHGHGLVRFVSQ